MKDCIKGEECEMKGMSVCCGAKIICTDICFDCREHTSDCCEECHDEYWEKMRKKNEFIYKDLI